MQELFSEHAMLFFHAWLPRSCQRLPLRSADIEAVGTQQGSCWQDTKPLADAALAAMKPRDALYCLPQIAVLVQAEVQAVCADACTSAPRSSEPCGSASELQIRVHAAADMVRWALYAASERVGALRRKGIGLLEDCLTAVGTLLQAQARRARFCCASVWPRIQNVQPDPACTQQTLVQASCFLFQSTPRAPIRHRAAAESELSSQRYQMPGAHSSGTHQVSPRTVLQAEHHA